MEATAARLVAGVSKGRKHVAVRSYQKTVSPIPFHALWGNTGVH